MDKSKRILIVETDGKFIQELLALFAHEDYDMEISRNFTDAVERIKNVKFDCAIINVNLAEIKGYDAVPIIKTINPGTCIIITTEENTRELEAEVRKKDIFYYYIKSFALDELKLAVRSVFEKLGKVKEEKKMDKPAKILIVDDDSDFVAGIRPILESNGHGIASACNKTEAMEKIEKFKPDLILLDIMMERLSDGFDICYKLKHDEKMRKIPVLAISAINEKFNFKFSPETDEEYFGADDFMEKPVKAADLLERVEKLLKE